MAFLQLSVHDKRSLTNVGEKIMKDPTLGSFIAPINMLSQGKIYEKPKVILPWILPMVFNLFQSCIFLNISFQDFDVSCWKTIKEKAFIQHLYLSDSESKIIWIRITFEILCYRLLKTLFNLIRGNKRWIFFYVK